MSATAPVLAAPPEIARVGAIARPPTGDVGLLRIFGEQLAGCEVHVWQPGGDADAIAASIDALPEFAALPAAPPAGAVSLTVAARFEQALFAEITPQRVRPGVAVVWLKNADGWSAPRLANRPDIHLTSHDEAMPGERIQLFGKRLSQRVDRRSNPMLVLRERASGATHRATWGKVRGQGPLLSEGDHRKEFVLPEDLPAGAYDLFFHNGSGGAHGWSEAIPLTVLASRSLTDYEAMAWNRGGIDSDTQQFTDLTVERVPREFADGTVDARDTVQQAIDKVAAAGGGVVQLPPGIIGVTGTLSVKPGVVLRGSGKHATTITVPYGKRFVRDESLERHHNQALIHIATRAGLRDLRLEGGPGVDHLARVRNFPQPSVNVFFNRVSMDSMRRADVL
ncbi:MAG: hypothetical protein GVY24_05590, partial [Planctomycetes bacterium]|nr:hypothetical protein [Planctomycetota bacterium]